MVYVANQLAVSYMSAANKEAIKDRIKKKISFKTFHGTNYKNHTKRLNCF